MQKSGQFDESKKWLAAQGNQAFPFQIEVWQSIALEQSGLLNAPTGSGKTYALWLGFLQSAIQNQWNTNQKVLRFIWITPLRALATDIAKALQEAVDGLEIPWQVALRTGDTSTADRAKQKRAPAQVLVTTPESLHLILASKNYQDHFAHLSGIAVDEWHELMGTKRGVMMELGLSRLRAIKPKLLVWGISATIGNLEQALAVLMSNQKKGIIIKANIQKHLTIKPVLPDEIEQFPWAGHLGVKLLDQVLQIIAQSKTTLIFTNTRAQAEIWYQYLLNADPSLAGLMAMHHGSISNELRNWVEQQIGVGNLKAVVCTSSLDLGVDFRPVDQIVQIGSPKGIARFLQRAGRSGHRPGAESVIHFVPTNALELIECAAIREAIKSQKIESRNLLPMSFDVLIQYLITLAVSDGFFADDLYSELVATYTYQNLTSEQYQWVLDFITKGGNALNAYDDFHKVAVHESGLHQVLNKRIAMRHRLNIGAIVSDAMLLVQFKGGQKLGVVEEWFVAKLKTGDTFWFAGRALELIAIRDMKVTVKLSNKQKATVPAWMGGRISFSSQLTDMIRLKLSEYHQTNKVLDQELQVLKPLLDLQNQRSAVPLMNQFLIETFESRDGYHVFFYPFEGHPMHEGLASLIAYRIAKLSPMSFSMAMNDYGFELLSDSPIPLIEALEENLFTTDHLDDDIKHCVNAAEMAKRKFRDISSIAGLVFTGFPGKKMGQKHLQMSGSLLFNVFSEYDPESLLLKQAYEEVYSQQVDISRVSAALTRIGKQQFVIKNLTSPSPFSFPIMVDRLRSRLSSEKLEDRIKKMQLAYEK